MVPNCTKWSKTVQIGPNGLKWSQVVSNDPKWSEMIPNGLKWSQIVPNSSIMFPIGSKCSTCSKWYQMVQISILVYSASFLVSGKLSPFPPYNSYFHIWSLSVSLWQFWVPYFPGPESVPVMVLVPRRSLFDLPVWLPASRLLTRTLYHPSTLISLLSQIKSP